MKKGKSLSKESTAQWAFSDEELEKVLSRHKTSSPKIVRYKGLGEMNPDTLWETTLDPQRRTLLKVSTDDEEQAMEALKSLMGSDPSTRYRLICDSAESLELDI